jgi:hypothetical protein
MVNVWDQRRTSRWVGAMKHLTLDADVDDLEMQRHDRRARRRPRRARSVEHARDRFHRSASASKSG